MTYRVSVVIPAFNSAEWLTESVASALEQTYPPLEVIVVDDGSTDDTEQLASRFPRSVKYIKQRNSGPAVARNNGIRKSKGDFVAFLDADDRWHPDKLKRQSRLLALRDDIGVVFSNYSPFGDPVPYLSGFERSPLFNKLNKAPLGPDSFVLEADVFNALLQDLFCWTSTLLVRRTAIEAAGLYDESLRFAAEDWSFCLRLSKVARFAFVNDALAFRREHVGSLSRTAPDSEQAVIALNNLLADGLLAEADRESARRLLSELLFTNAYQAHKRGDLENSCAYFRHYLRLPYKSRLSRRFKARLYLTLMLMPTYRNRTKRRSAAA